MKARQKCVFSKYLLWRTDKSRDLPGIYLSGFPSCECESIMQFYTEGRQKACDLEITRQCILQLHVIHIGRECYLPKELFTSWFGIRYVPRCSCQLIVTVLMKFLLSYNYNFTMSKRQHQVEGNCSKEFLGSATQLRRRLQSVLGKRRAHCRALSSLLLLWGETVRTVTRSSNWFWANTVLLCGCRQLIARQCGASELSFGGKLVNLFVALLLLGNWPSHRKTIGS